MLPTLYLGKCNRIVNSVVSAFVQRAPNKEKQFLNEDITATVFQRHLSY